MKPGFGFTSIVIVILSLFLYSCGEEGETEVPSAGTRISQGGSVTDYLSLVDNLRAAGAAVTPIDSITQVFFIPKGQVIEVDGQNVQVFEFESADVANATASTISLDGQTIGETQVDWEAPVHFYRSGRLIVIYIGDNGDLISILEDVLGPKFAGD